MSDSRRATVLILDDGEDQSALAEHLDSTDLVRARVLHPNDLESNDLLKTDLVLIDYQLDDWPERDELSQLALKPRDGLALASILRRHAQEHEKNSPTAIAILTGKIDKLATPLPYEHREHILAHMNGLEWVFQKSKAEVDSPLVIQIAELATAVARLPQKWIVEDAQSLSQLAKLLGIEPEAPVSDKLLEDVEDCTPPIHELSEWSHGLAVLRWLLHRILPYPCFLWDTHHVAARLTVDHKGFLEALIKNDKLNGLLGDCEYKGILAKFLGRKWWRSRIEFLLWETTGGQSADPKIVRKRIAEVIGEELPPSQPPVNPLICINSDYQALDQFYSITESVRIRPDDWPPYADQAWTTVESAKSEPKLGSLVIQEDRDRLS